MSLTRSIHIRLTAEQSLLYETEAAYAGQTLSCYLREQLENRQRITTELREQRLLLEKLVGESTNSMKADNNDGGLLPSRRELAFRAEQLLLLRLLAGTERVLQSQQELKRLGLTPWSGQEGGAGDQR